MQLISVINADLLAPYDVAHLATVLFQSVQHGAFQNTWKQPAEWTALSNMQLPQEDHCHAVGVDVLLSNGPFSNPESQAQ